MSPRSAAMASEGRSVDAGECFGGARHEVAFDQLAGIGAGRWRSAFACMTGRRSGSPTPRRPRCAARSG